MPRGTPIPRLLPFVLKELQAAGVPHEAVTLLTAQGTHREMTESELKHKLGEFHGRFALHQHRTGGGVKAWQEAGLCIKPGG